MYMVKWGQDVSEKSRVLSDGRGFDAFAGGFLCMSNERDELEYGVDAHAPVLVRGGPSSMARICAVCHERARYDRAMWCLRT